MQLASSGKKHDLPTSPVRLKLTELYEELHFNQLCLHDAQSARIAAAEYVEYNIIDKSTELRNSEVVNNLPKSFLISVNNGRTYGNISYRKSKCESQLTNNGEQTSFRVTSIPLIYQQKWSMNQLTDNELFSELALSPAALGKRMNRLRLRPSPPTPGERNLRLHWQQNSAACTQLLRNQRKALSAPTVTRSQARNVGNPSLKLNFKNFSQDQKRPSTTNKIKRTTNIDNNWATSKSRNFSPPNSHSLGRSQTFVDLVRPGLRGQTRIRIPQTPLNSPDTGIKVVRVTSKDQEQQTETKDHSSNENKKELNVQLPKDNIKNQTFSELTDSTFCTTDAKHASDIVQKRSLKKPEHSATSFNLSRQLLDLRKTTNVSFAKTDWMKIKSFHNKNETRLKRPLQKCSEKTPSNKIYNLEQTDFQPEYQKEKNKQRDSIKPTLQIKLMETRFIKESPHFRKTALTFSPKVAPSNLISKHQIRRNKKNAQEEHQFNQRKKESLGEGASKYCNFSFFDESPLTVPNPSLVDFGKRSAFTSRRNVDEMRTNGFCDADQDPAVMMRILSWLEKVEQNSEFYYGFDDKT